MTSIQLAYQEHLERVRHDVATEVQAMNELQEAKRHNVVYEQESQRHNLQDESVRRIQADASWQQALASLSQARTQARQAEQTILESKSRQTYNETQTYLMNIQAGIQERTMDAQILQEWSSAVGGFVGTATKIAGPVATMMGLA